ncbi:MAG: DUF2905 family protein [Acidobacteriaceae bacterium]
MMHLAKLLILTGVALVVAGGALLLLARLGLPLGRLPGDISYRGKNVSFFAPLGTSLLLSLLLTVLLYLISRFRR